VTEAEWDRSADPARALKFLLGSGKFTDRKARLFAVAVCRRIWPLLEDQRDRHAVEVAQQFADGQATGDDLRLACEGGDYPTLRALGEAEAEGRVPAGYAPIDLAYRADFHYLPRVTDALARAAADATAATGLTVAGERAAQAELLRCLLGNPFRPVEVDHAWLAWHGGAAVKLAQAVYEERELPSGHLDAGRLAVLADMLEEAGCADAALLAHLRSRGPHVRGCWVIDLLLNKL
jgi:hypothetical protein